MNCSSRLLRRAALPALPLALSAVPAAQANIIYTDPSDVTINPGSNSIIYFDVNLDGGGNPVRNSYFAGYDFNMYFTYGNGANPYVLNNFSYGRVAGDPFPWMGKLFHFNANETIDGSLTFNGFGGDLNDNGTNDANWAAGTNGFLGLRLTQGGNTYYGWAQLTYGTDLSLTLHDFAYNDVAQAPILAGQKSSASASIPDSTSTVVALGLGLLLAGSAAHLRRRQESVATA